MHHAWCSLPLVTVPNAVHFERRCRYFAFRITAQKINRASPFKQTEYMYIFNRQKHFNKSVVRLIQRQILGLKSEQYKVSEN